MRRYPWRNSTRTTLLPPLIMSRCGQVNPENVAAERFTPTVRRDTLHLGRVTLRSQIADRQQQRQGPPVIDIRAFYRSAAPDIFAAAEIHQVNHVLGEIVRLKSQLQPEPLVFRGH